MEGRRSERETLYRLDIEAKKHNPKTERALTASQVKPLSFWHQCFGHLNLKTLLKMTSIGSATWLCKVLLCKGTVMHFTH